MSEPVKEFWEDDHPADQTLVRRRKSRRFSIKSIMILTAVACAAAFSAGYFYRGVYEGNSGIAMGQFALVNSMMPTVFLAGAFLFYKLFGRYLD